MAQILKVPTSRIFNFAAGKMGDWHIKEIFPIVGESLVMAERLSISAGKCSDELNSSAWVLKGKTSNDRYVELEEKKLLINRQESLGRLSDTCGALIPLRKNAAWWALTQDERRHIFEEQSHHIKIGLKYLPAIARRLHHCRDLDDDQAFDFLTWFEFAPEHTSAFEELLELLRASEEWKYVDREVDIRVSRLSV